jgi:hypothetical protein
MLGKEKTFSIDENNFEKLQEILKEIFCVSNNNNQ